MKIIQLTDEQLNAFLNDGSLPNGEKLEDVNDGRYAFATETDLSEIPDIINRLGNAVMMNMNQIQPVPNREGEDDCDCPVCDMRRTVESMGEPKTAEEIFAFLNTILGQEPSESEQPEVVKPSWAYHPVSDDTVVAFTRLISRNPGRVDNGMIFDIQYDLEKSEPVFYIISDAGKIEGLSWDAMVMIYHKPEWVMEDFLNDAIRQMADQWYESTYVTKR